MTVAARQRRHRQRQRRGLICLSVTVREAALADALAAAGLLPDDAGDDREKLARAIEHALETWATEHEEKVTRYCPGAPPRW